MYIGCINCVCFMKKLKNHYNTSHPCLRQSFGWQLLRFIFYFCLFTFHLSSQWVQQTVPVNKPITGIEFVDSLKGWACTSRGTPADTGYILYTSNGGTNWLVQLPVYNFEFFDMDIINSLTGYASGYDYNIGLDKLFKT